MELELRCVGCGRTPSQVGIFYNRCRKCVTCYKHFRWYGTYQRLPRRPQRPAYLTPDEMLEWLLRGAEVLGGHILVSDAVPLITTYQRANHRPGPLRWVLAHGPIPPGLSVLHSVDCERELGPRHSRCVRLSHLRLGTQAENMRDVAYTGVRRGEKNTNSKLTEDQVREIRHRLRRGYALGEIASDFGVCRTSIINIKKGITWRHVV